MSQVCVVIPYFGSWPAYFPLFIKSCSYNPGITFLFFTDLQPPDEVPPNVQFHYYELSQIKNSLESHIGSNVALSEPYKLCDLRPAYALLFKKFISTYEFWGWGDIDMIFGRIEDYLTPELLSSFDVISFREKWLSGSLCMIRNREDLNTLFMKASDKEAIFGSAIYKGFDEISCCWREINLYPFEAIRWPHDNFTRLVLKEAKKGSIRTHFNKLIKESIPKGDYLVWENGSLIDSRGMSYLYYHFITEKRMPYFRYPDDKDVADIYYITSTGFYSDFQFKHYTAIKVRRVLAALPVMIRIIFRRAVSALKH